MASPTEIAERYFKALSDHDLEMAGSLWAPDGIDRFVGQEEVVGPAGVRDYFSRLYVASRTSHSRYSRRLPVRGGRRCAGGRAGRSRVSDCFYTLDLRTGMKAIARVPHPATNFSTEQAAASIRKPADLNPSAAWAGHTDPVTGDVVGQLRRAADAAPV